MKGGVWSRGAQDGKKSGCCPDVRLADHKEASPPSQGYLVSTNKLCPETQHRSRPRVPSHLSVGVSVLGRDLRVLFYLVSART